LSGHQLPNSPRRSGCPGRGTGAPCSSASALPAPCHGPAVGRGCGRVMRAYREGHCRVTALGEGVSSDTRPKRSWWCSFGSRGGDSVGPQRVVPARDEPPSVLGAEGHSRSRCPAWPELRCTARGGAVEPTRGPPCGRWGALASTAPPIESGRDGSGRSCPVAEQREDTG
jgi:hypothetical protein